MANAAYVSQPFAANGGTNGVVTVKNAVGFKRGAQVSLSAANVSTQQAVIVEVFSGTTFGVRFSNSQSFGYSNISAYTTAGGATVTQPDQTIDDHDEAVVMQVQSQSGELIPLKADVAGGIGDSPATIGHYTETLVLTTATLLGSLPNRRTITVANLGPNTIFIGFDTNITINNGFPLPTMASMELPIQDSLTVYSICGVNQLMGSGTRILELG